MRLLLDTHIFLWWRQGARSINQEARRAIAEADSVIVSAASAWEAAIKVALGKLRIPAPFGAAVEDSGFDKLPIDFAHASAVTALPPHHRDPFDRMLIAQALVEQLTLVTRDERFRPYGVPILWA